MRCLEIFAGAGGAALGLEAAGIEHAALCEWDPSACATLRSAGLGPVVEGDVRDLDAITSVAGERCDLLWSSFPCQAWSTAGQQKGAKDERNGWPWTVDAIDRFRPRWFLGENVRGLITHSTEGHPDPFACPRCYFEHVVLGQLRARFAHVGWWLLDAADYGVPQHRRRVIIWAGPAPLRAPRTTHGSPAAARQRDLFGNGVKPWRTMGEALGISTNHRAVEGKPPQVKDVTDRPSPTVVCHWGKDGDKSRQAVRIVNAEPWVVAARETGTGRRRLTVEECATLQGFPADHPWQGTKTARYRQVGNAVPPRLAEVVGRAVMSSA